MVPEPPLRPWPLRAFALVALSLFCSVVTWRGAILRAPSTQNGDGQYFTRVMDIAHVSVLRYRELPLWNAYECGGVPLWDNPEMPVASPLVYLTLPLSATKTMMVWYIVHATVGFIGMWLFSRRELSLSRNAAFAASALWAYGVGHTTQYAGGHAALTTFLFLPLVLFFWRRAEEDVDYAVAMGLAFAWIMLEGGAYPMVHLSVVLAAEAVTRVRRPKRLLSIVRAGVIAVGVCLAVAACRFLPVFDQLRNHHRDLGTETDAISWVTLKSMLLDREHSWSVDGQSYVWPEYASYVGPVVLLLAFIGVIAGGLETLWLFVVGAFVFAMMLGHFASWAPWAYLRGHVFPFKAMRVPSRFRLSFVLFLASFVGIAMDRVPRWFARMRRMPRLEAPVHTAMLGIALLAVGDVAGLAADIVDKQFTSPLELEVMPSPKFYLEGPGLAAFLDQPRQGRGRLACQDSWPFTDGAPLWTGDQPQAKPADDAATFRYVDRTPSRMLIGVDAKRPAKILVNLPYEKGWRTNVGALHEENKLLVLEVPAGHWRVRLRYWPWGLTVGLWTSAIGTLASIAFLTRRRLVPLSRRFVRWVMHKPA